MFQPKRCIPSRIVLFSATGQFAHPLRPHIRLKTPPTQRNDDVSQVLSKFVRGALGESDVEAWAHVLECREDIGYANSTVREMLYDFQIHC